MQHRSAPPEHDAVQVGRYTVDLAGGGHRTLEVAEADRDFRAGRWIVSYLCGPDDAYRAFAHITAGGVPRLWRRYSEDRSLAAALAGLVADPHAAAAAYRRGTPCARCRRPLIHPESIERGMGPRCARRMAAAIALAEMSVETA